jgi:protein-export membrane protein SecD
MAQRSSAWPAATAIAGLVLLFVALPSGWKSWAPSWFNPPFHFGLDLAGGTQLDFRISEDELRAQLAQVETDLAAAEAAQAGSDTLNVLREQRRVIQDQQQNIVEAIRTVLERRINSLGVSEATITPSYVGDEKHLLVECPGVIDTQTCIDTVGKTIQLEFKEQQTEATPEYEATVRASASAALADIRSGSGTLQSIGQDMGDELGMSYSERRTFFRDQLPKGLESLWTTQPAGVVQMAGSLPTVTQNDDGTTAERDVNGIFLVESLGPKTQTGRVLNEASTAFAQLASQNEGLTVANKTDVPLDASMSVRVAGALRGMQPGGLAVAEEDDGTAHVLFLRSFAAGKEQVDVSHVLVSYKGAQSAAASVTRTKDEAFAHAQEIRDRIDGGEDFDAVARTDNDALTKDQGGKIGAVGREQLAPAFAEAAFGGKTGQILGPIETPFGYHVIKVNREKFTTSDVASYDDLVVTGDDAADRAKDFLDDLQSGRVTRPEEALALRLLFFSLEPTGWKDTPLDGKHFRSATAVLDPTTNIPVVQIAFDDEGAHIFQELTKANIGKQIAIFVGGELVTAPRVESEITGGTAVITGSANVQEAQKLAQDLNTGAIPAPIHLVGQRTVEPTLGAEALSTSVKAGLIGILVVMLYMILFYRAFGVVASLALTFYAVIFLALFKLPLFLFSDQYMVLTLAGAAGLILSIGMAVDTNVLVFERVKEELRKGKGLATSVDIGFEKAWPSVRDSNISTLITCALLFLIGTSIVRGFAITLGIGVLISMFTGMLVSHWIARRLAATSLAGNAALFPGTQKQA